jgi:cellulose synthase/poly-beta-1,6-N-acetylglucosamine synthase-like glycosyltransferase
MGASSLLATGPGPELLRAVLSVPSGTVGDVTRTILVDLQWVILGYFLALNGFLLVLLGLAALELRRDRAAEALADRWRVLGSEVAPRISILAPAYNEAATVVESVRSLLTLRYPDLEIVLVNDGSKDDTLGVLRQAFDTRPEHPIHRAAVHHQPIVGVARSAVAPNLVVVDKENGGKADALNAALNVASGELVCAIDADTLIEPEALLRMVRPFLLRADVVAAGGTIRAVNGSSVDHGRVVTPRAPRGFLAGVQAVEYLRAYLTGRLGWNRMGGNLIISGAFGLFRRDAVLAADGYEHATVGEDMELVARLRRRAYEEGGPGRVVFVPDPVAWTEVPDMLSVLGRQRDRWHRGLADVLVRHRGVALRPRYGSLGFVAYPYFVLVELLGPVVEAVGLIGLVAGLLTGSVNWPFAVLFLLVAYGLGLIMTVLTIALEEWSYRGYGGGRDTLVLLGWALIEPLGYRQLTVVWRLRGLWKYARGNTDWGVMTRRGFSTGDGEDGDAGAGAGA